MLVGWVTGTSSLPPSFSLVWAGFFRSGYLCGSPAVANVEVAQGQGESLDNDVCGCCALLEGVLSYLSGYSATFCR
jgi:hypothetical protein